MVDSREFSTAAENVAAACAHYLLQSTVASTHALHLYEQVIACVARRQLSPEALQSSLMRFAQTQSLASQTNVSAAANAFANALASCTAIPDTYFAELAALANGEKTASEARRESTRSLNKSIARDLSHTASAWFAFLGALDEQRGRAAEAYLVDVLRRVNPIGFDGDVVELSGPINTRIETVITFDNALAERTLLRCDVVDVRRADGVGPAFIPALVLSPKEIIVDGDNAAELSLSLWLDADVYATQSPYVGSLHVSRDDAPRLDLPLRITPTLSPS